MKSIFIAVFCLLAATAIGATIPEAPSTQFLARLCKVPPETVSRTVKTPDMDPKLKDRMFWLATYAFSKPVNFGITLVLVPHGKFKDNSFALIASHPELEYRKIDLQNGDVLHHLLGDQGDQGTFYSTTLISADRAFDATLIVSRQLGISDSSLPIDIKTAGIDLIQRLIENLNTAQQDAAANP